MTNETTAPRVVVGVDGSESSVHALQEGQKIAMALGAELRATICWEYPSLFAAPQALGQIDLEGDATAALAKAVEQAFGTELPANVTTTVIRGLTRPVLIEASTGAAMLVVGRRGHGGFSGLVLGSVSAACVSHANCPVLVVHQGM